MKKKNMEKVIRHKGYINNVNSIAYALLINQSSLEYSDSVRTLTVLFSFTISSDNYIYMLLY